MEGDCGFAAILPQYVNFNPLPPCGGRLYNGSAWVHSYSISIHSLRVEGDYDGEEISLDVKNISIHSLRVEGDISLLYQLGLVVSISIHSLRVEGDIIGAYLEEIGIKFQSTPSVWRETAPGSTSNWYLGISIHSLRVEGDNAIFNNGKIYKVFQSTPSVWRET